MLGATFNVCEKAFSQMKKKKIKNLCRSRITNDQLHHGLRAGTSNFHVTLKNKKTIFNKKYRIKHFTKQLYFPYFYFIITLKTVIFTH